MHTTRTDSPAITFVHNGDPNDGKLHIVTSVNKDPDVRVETQNFNGEDVITLTLPYNVVREFVLSKIVSAQIAKLEQLDGDDLYEHFVKSV